MGQPRVGLFCGYLDPMLDGVADYTRHLAVHLRRAGFEPLIVTTHERARAFDGAIGVAERWDLRGMTSAARELRRLRLDVAHVQFAPSVFRFSRAVGLLPLILPEHIPLVVTLHEYGRWAEGGASRGRWWRSALWSAAEGLAQADRETLLLVPRATRVLVSSPEHVGTIRARFRGGGPAALEVPIGLNVEVTDGDRTQVRAEVRNALGAASDAPLITFFGFLHQVKALDRLILAVAALRAHLPETRLLLIGGAESHSVSSAAARQLRRELERTAETCGMLGRVHFTGYLPDGEVSRLLLAADAAAFPRNDGVTRKSGSLLAAFAAGLPVVATALPGQVSGPAEDGAVLRVPPRDTKALTSALIRVLSDRDLARRLTEAGRSVVASQSWEAIAAAHAEVYSEALAARGGRGSETRPRIVVEERQAAMEEW